MGRQSEHTGGIVVPNSRGILVPRLSWDIFVHAILLVSAADL